MLRSDWMNFYFEIANLQSDESFSSIETNIRIYFSIPIELFFSCLSLVFSDAKSLVFLQNAFWQFGYAKFYNLVGVVAYL